MSAAKRQKRVDTAPQQTVEVVEDNEEKNEEDSDEDERLYDDEEWMNVDGIQIPPAIKPTLSFDPTGPRLLITKISNNFFKSYAEEQILGPFHKCFNAIVGPNGSGKSNVIDSLLFVFGYRATKIRCKKVSVLLHNSEKYRNVGQCTVAIHFALIVDKEGDNYDIVPGSEFVVSRTAVKDNSSYYELNGRRVQFKEIAVLLKKHGIDLDHNRFLILQGEVEQISMMKCKADKDGESGMLEYLEDIIGTSRYKKPLGEVHERVEYLSERRSDKLNRLKLVEDELQELKGPMEEAVGFLQTENTIIKCKNFLYQKNIFEVKQKEEEEEKKRDEVLEIQKAFIAKLEKLEKKKSEKLEVQNQEAKLYESLKKKSEELKEKYSKMDKRDTQLCEDMTNKNKTRKETKKLIEKEKANLTKLENVPEESENSVKEFTTKMEQKAAEKEKLEGEKSCLLQNIQRETKGLQEKKEEMQKDLAVLKEAVDKTKSAFNLAETELKVCVSNEVSEQNKLENMKNTFETNQNTLRERKEQVASLKRKIPATEKSLNDASNELQQIKVEEANVINEIRSKRLNLEEGRSSMQATKSSGRVLDSLMQAKREGKCRGLFGRLGDLGAIDQKYDVAVSTACGPLDNIVVDTVDCAQWCIEFLKKHDIGRGVFIALEKQEHLRDAANSRIHTPENVHRLYDLIKVEDERVKTAFYYALRDTLVANDLEQASRIAYGARRYRVVTLKGDLIETTGTMSGGGRQQLRGRMGQRVATSNQVDPRDLEKLETQIQKLEDTVRELRQKQHNLEGQINTLQPELRQMKIDYEKFNRELQSLEQQQPNLARQIKEQENKASKTKADAGQVQRLTKIVDERREEYEQAAETAGALQIKVDEITKEIKEKSTNKIQAIDKKIRECTKLIERCKTEITSAKVAVKTAERKYKTTKDNIARMEQDVEDMENSLRQMKAEREKIEDVAKEVLADIESTTAELTEKESAYNEIKQEMEKISKKENEIKSEKVDVDQKLKGHQKILSQYKATIQGWDAKLGQLKLQDIPNESMSELEIFDAEKFSDEDKVRTVEKELQGAEHYLKVAKPNLSAIQEYRKKQDVFMVRSKELEEITTKRSEMRKLYDNLRTQRREEFITGYNIIKLKLKEMYQMITLGGDAEFEMVDTFDPFTEGIQFNVRPPRKTWKKISNLSGGEKTLSSLALVFALHYYKPSPLYVMDEIDAALDFKNVSIVGNYIKDRTKNAQFIIISLRSQMFELCDNLIGIYKTYNTTKTLTINPRLYGEEPTPTSQPRPTQENRTGISQRNTAATENSTATTGRTTEASTVPIGSGRPTQEENKRDHHSESTPMQPANQSNTQSSDSHMSEMSMPDSQAASIADSAMDVSIPDSQPNSQNDNGTPRDSETSSNLSAWINL